MLANWKRPFSRPMKGLRRRGRASNEHYTREAMPGIRASTGGGYRRKNQPTAVGFWNFGSTQFLRPNNLLLELMSTDAGCCGLRVARGFQLAYRQGACPVSVPLPLDSVPGLSLMPERQDEYRVRSLVVTVKRHVARIAKIDDQFSQIGFILKRAPYPRLSGQQL